MALRIRLRRMGRKKAPHYRIVVAEASMPRDGRFVERIGHYNPRTEPATLVVNQERARLWISRGAKPTDTVEALFRRSGVYGSVPAAAQPAAPAAASRKAAAPPPPAPEPEPETEAPEASAEPTVGEAEPAASAADEPAETPAVEEPALEEPVAEETRAPAAEAAAPDAEPVDEPTETAPETKEQAR